MLRKLYLLRSSFTYCVLPYERPFPVYWIPPSLLVIFFLDFFLLNFIPKKKKKKASLLSVFRLSSICWDHSVISSSDSTIGNICSVMDSCDIWMTFILVLIESSCLEIASMLSSEQVLRKPIASSSI